MASVCAPQARIADAHFPSGRLPTREPLRRRLPARRAPAQGGGAELRQCSGDQAGARCRSSRRAACPTLHSYALEWVDRHAGLGHDTVREPTRREYRRLLITFALRYFQPEVRLRELDRLALQGFVSWLAAYRGSRGRLSDRSIANVVGPLRLCLESAAREGLIENEVSQGLVLPRRRGGRGWHFEQGRFLTREQLRRLLAEIPEEWRPFFDVLASTGLRLSEAIALRWCDLRAGGAGPPLGAALDRKGRGGSAEVALRQALCSNQPRAGSLPGGATRPSFRRGSPCLS